MKFIITLSIILSTSCLFSQVKTEAQRWENARFLVVKQNQEAFKTIIKSKGATFTKEEFKSIQSNSLLKEGIFDVKILENNQAIEIYYISFIEIETIKSFVLPIKSDVYFSEKEEVQFQ